MRRNNCKLFRRERETALCIEAIEAVIQQSEQVGPRYQLLWVIAWHINRDTGDWPLGIHEIGHEAHLTERQVYRHLVELEASGELIIAHRPGRRNVYRLAYFTGIAERGELVEIMNKLSTPPGENARGVQNARWRKRQGGGGENARGGGGENARGVLYIPDSLPEGVPEGHPSPDLSTSVQYRLAGPFSRWQMEQAQAAQRRAQ